LGQQGWANFRPLIGICIQNIEPTCNFWANSANFYAQADKMWGAVLGYPKKTQRLMLDKEDPNAKDED
jgi:hypothetical protein